MVPAPGTAPLPAPSWWAKRNRLIFPPQATLTLVGFAPIVGTSLPLTIRPAPALLTLTGFAPGINGSQVYRPAAASLTLTGSAPNVVVPATSLSIIGTPMASAHRTIALPTHAAGDIIIMGASTSGSTAPSAPVAGGSVPTWNTVDSDGDGNGGIRTAYAIATGSSHTSGTWTGAAELAVIVLRGQDPIPIGGHGVSTGSSISDSTAPAVTMTQTSGTSKLLHFFFGGCNSWSGAPSGYTRQASAINGTDGLCLDTKDVSTSDGSVTHTFGWAGFTAGYRGATVEIRQLTFIIAPTGATLTLTGGTPLILIPRVVTPTAATLTLTGGTPIFGSGYRPAGAALTLTGSAPVIRLGPNVIPTDATLTLTGGTPTVLTPQLVTPTAATLTLTGSAPMVRSGPNVAPAGATLTLTGSAPVIRGGPSVTTTGATLTLTGGTPIFGSGYRPAGAALALTGGTPIFGSGLRPAGAALTLTAGTPTIVIYPHQKPTIIGTPAAVRAATSITLPTHAVGDIIVLYAFRVLAGAVPGMPTAGGTVPAWVDIDATGSSNCAGRTAYFVATATNHTSGTWASASGLAAIVLRGQHNVTPIGGHDSVASSGSSASGPSVTMSVTDGTSMLLHFFSTQALNSVWASAPAGYTRQATAESSFGTGVCLNTKDVTTSDGSTTQSTTNGACHGATVEIVAL